MKAATGRGSAARSMALALVLAFLVASCGLTGGGASDAVSGDQGQGQGAPGDGGDETEGGFDGIFGPDEQAAPAQPEQEPSDAPPSIITFREYEWAGDNTVSIVDLHFPSNDVRRVLQRPMGNRHQSGDLVFVEDCGQDVTRIGVAGADGGIELITPCSREVPNPGFSDTSFTTASLSPDQRRVAVEARFFYDERFQFSVLVYEDGVLTDVFDGHWAPTWLDNDTVLMAGGGLFVADVGGTPQSIDGGTLASGTNNPSVHPDGQQVVFEWNQQIWRMNLDGSGLEELVSGPSAYRFPVWAPDGTGVAFLSLPSFNQFEEAIFVLDMRTREFLVIDLPTMAAAGHVPNGPISWTAPTS